MQQPMLAQDIDDFRYLVSPQDVGWPSGSIRTSTCTYCHRCNTIANQMNHPNRVTGYDGGYVWCVIRYEGRQNKQDGGVFFASLMRCLYGKRREDMNASTSQTSRRATVSPLEASWRFFDLILLTKWSLHDVRCGWMAFLTSEKEGEEFVFMQPFLTDITCSFLCF